MDKVYICGYPPCKSELVFYRKNVTNKYVELYYACPACGEGRASRIIVHKRWLELCSKL